MFKEIVISLVIIIGIFSLDIFTQGYTNKSTAEMTKMLTDLKEKIINQNYEELQTSIKEIDDIWGEQHDNLAYYIEHDELEKVDKALIKMKSHLETKDYTLAIAELEEGKFVLEHIKDKNSVNFQNIF